MRDILGVLMEVTIYSVLLYVVIVLFKRVFKNHVSAVLGCGIWILLVLRLMLPVTIETGFSFFIIPETETLIVQTQSGERFNAEDNTKPQSKSAMPFTQTESNNAQKENEYTVTQEKPVYEPSVRTAVWKMDWPSVLVIVWASGVLVLAAHTAWLFRRLHRKISRGGVPVPEYICALVDECKKDMGLRAKIRVSVQSWLDSPALSCSLSPTLLLPQSMVAQGETANIMFGIRHELTHYRRKDHLMSLLMMLLRCIYWFNPVVHLAFRQIQIDMEMACDAGATKHMERSQRIRYIETMIGLSGKACIQYVLGMGMCRGRKAMEKRMRGVLMKRKSSLGVKTAAVLLAGLLIVCCFTTACQPTPEQPIVVNKNKDLVEEVKSEAVETDAETSSPGYLGNLILPERYSFSSENEAASLKISVDAQVDKPEADKMPFARVAPMTLTQDMVTGMFNYLFPDEKPIVPREQFTKSEIEEQILHYKKMISNGFDGEPLDDEQKADFEQGISDLEKEYETAPEEEPEPVICDGTLQKKEFKEITCYELNAFLSRPDNDIGTNLFIRTGNDMSGMSVWYTNVDSTFSTDGMVRVREDGELPEAARGKLKLTLSEAVAKADGFFEAAGIDDVKLFAAYVVDNHGTGHVDDNYDPASEYAYRLFYTHTVNGVPVSCHESDSASGNEYTEPWFYESIEFTISDDGFLEIQWYEPGTVTEVIEEDAKLIDFDTAMQAFENAVTYTYGQYMDWGEDAQGTVDVSIDNIQLNLIRIREKDKPGEKAGLYVPAYVFYGSVKQKTEYKNEDYVYEGYMTSSGGGNDFYPGPLMVMAVNAIDGSVIDTMKDVT